MSGTATAKRPGRNPISNDLWNMVIDLHQAGKVPKEIMAATGLGSTKVYEVLRSGTRKEQWAGGSSKPSDPNQVIEVIPTTQGQDTSAKLGETGS